MTGIIELAREAGFEQNSLGMTYTSGSLSALLERFAALVRADALEEAAGVAESFSTDLRKWPDAPNGETAETKFVRGIGDAMSPISTAIRQLKESK